MTPEGHTNISGGAATGTQMIIDEWLDLLGRLDAKLARRDSVNADIRDLRTEIAGKRKVIRVVAPELLKSEPPE